MKGRRPRRRPPAAINVMTLPLICSSADRSTDRSASQPTHREREIRWAYRRRQSRLLDDEPPPLRSEDSGVRKCPACQGWNFSSDPPTDNTAAAEAAAPSKPPASLRCGAVAAAAGGGRSTGPNRRNWRRNSGISTDRPTLYRAS